MNEEEREIIKKFERLYLKDFNNEKITNEDRLSYIECALMTNLIEKLQKENELAKKQVEYDKTHIYTPQTIKLNYIPVQKVKDKIKEIGEKIKYEENEKVVIYLHKQKNILQELLESEV